MKPRLTKVLRADIDVILRTMAESAPITPERVVKAAENRRSPLHACFEWDNTKAAAAYRLEQARTLIRSVEVTVVVEDRPVEVCYFVRDPSKEAGQQGYVTLDQLRRDPSQARQHLQLEIGAVLASLRRAEEYARVLHMETEFDQVRTSVRTLAARIEGQPMQ